MQTFWKLFSLILLILILWLAFEKCRGMKVQTDLAAKSDSLAQKVAQDSIDYETALNQFRVKAMNAALQVKDVRDSLGRSEVRLYQSQGKINSLITRLEKARQQPFDSSFIYVSPDYVTACDSLGIVAGEQDKLLAEAKKNKDDLIDLMNYEIVLRDSMIEKDNEALAVLRADFNAQKNLTQQAIERGKPRTKVYAGISALGNNVQPFGGGEVSGMLVTKKDQAFEIGAGFFGKEWYGRVGVKFKIKF